MENQAYFTPNDVSQITEVTKRTLHYYHEIELLVPLILHLMVIVIILLRTSLNYRPFNF